MPGQIISAQGALGSEMYLLKSGSAEVSIKDHESRGQSKVVTHIKAGQCFGCLFFSFELFLYCIRTTKIPVFMFANWIHR